MRKKYIVTLDIAEIELGILSPDLRPRVGHQFFEMARPRPG